MRRTLKEIREELGFSFRDMADTLYLTKATYQGYETGRRPAPREVLASALQSLRRNKAFWRNLPKRVDDHQIGNVPNEAEAMEEMD